MARRITERELRNDSGEIMRALTAGESFVVTSDGVPVGELNPVRPTRSADASELVATFAGSPRLDAARFREDIDAVVDQAIALRA
ncbi:MAG: hypothetical protein J7513_16315 [Solirubrobacteraceae bacterium]|nr:hypothetical protein [Solirubrobacteraceae bacterium]